MRKASGASYTHCVAYVTYVWRIGAPAVRRNNMRPGANYIVSVSSPPRLLPLRLLTLYIDVRAVLLTSNVDSQPHKWPPRERFDVENSAAASNQRRSEFITASSTTTTAAWWASDWNYFMPIIVLRADQIYPNPSRIMHLSADARPCEYGASGNSDEKSRCVFCYKYVESFRSLFTARTVVEKETK